MKQKRTIIGIIICIVILIGVGITLSKQNLQNLFVPVKDIHNIVDFSQCQEGDFVKIKVTKAYETEYYYSENRTRSSKVFRHRIKWICPYCSSRKRRSTKNNQ